MSRKEAIVPTMQSTQVYLEREQKKALQAKAEANGTKVAEEVRRAVDAYLAGISPEDLQMLDAGTRKAERNLKEMTAELDRIHATLDATFPQLSQTFAEVALEGRKAPRNLPKPG